MSMIKHGASTSSARRALVAACMLCVILSACGEGMAKGRVRSALVEAGLSEGNADCMAERMTDRLSWSQLMKLNKLKGERRSLADYLAAARKIDDPEIWGVTGSAAALCAIGLAPERK